MTDYRKQSWPEVQEPAVQNRSEADAANARTKHKTLHQVHRMWHLVSADVNADKRPRIVS